jgi:histidine triad (HIT) family protein
MEDCIFCKIAKGDIPVETIYENDNFFSIPDKNPITSGHSLIISKKHFQNSLDLPSSSGGELLDCIKKTVEKLMKKEKFPGFNIINNNFEVAGQVVNHVHFHMIPRRPGDGLKMLV